MKKLLILLLSIFITGPVNGTQQTANGATLPGPAVTVSAGFDNLDFFCWDFYNNGFNKDSVTFDTDSSYSDAYVDILNTDGKVIGNDWDSNSNDSRASASLIGLDYNLSVSASPSFSLTTSLGASGGSFTAYTTKQMTFRSSKNGVLGVSFTYDLTAKLVDFSEDGYVEGYLDMVVGTDNGFFGPQITGNEDDSTTVRMAVFGERLAIPISAQTGEWKAKNNTGMLSFALEADRTYTLGADIYVYANTAEPLHTPIPGAAWLLGTGIVGLIGCRRKTEN